MKHLTLILLLWSSCTFAQKSEVFRIDSLPKEGILLDKGWKWHAGDDPEWAKVEYDDAEWEGIDPTKDIHDYPQLFDSKIRWLRLKFEIVHKYPNVLGLSVNQAGASEIYLDGKLIHRIGHISFDKIKAEDPLDYPFYLPISSNGKHLLAIRYVLQPQVHYTRVYGLTQNHVFRAKLVDLVNIQNALREFRVYYTGLEIFKIGLLFMLFVLHFAFFFYWKEDKSHLLLAIYFAGSLLQYVFKIIGQNQFSVEERYFYLNASLWVSGVGQLFAVVAFYRLSKVRLDIYFAIAVALMIVVLGVSSFNYGTLWGKMFLIVALFTLIVSLRLTIIGLRKNIKGFNMLGISIMISSLGFLFIEFLNNNIPIPPYIVDLVFNLSALSIPVGLSLFMGKDASERNKTMRLQLSENELLKNNAIAQEHEKQTILAVQNETLERQVTERTAELNQSLETLKTTQEQLIQREKMASLGELTAGIAHEIQNPLNFVNNFAEVSTELIEEMTEELGNGNQSEVETIAQDLKQNLEKINYHGKRASSIVKNMLEHSRTNAGHKEPTDINALIDECLRLSYHGMRGQFRNFQSDYELTLANHLPHTKVVKQDLGRVLLNLFNNAFYAVHEKMKQLEGTQQHDYVPKVSASSNKLKNGIEIRIKDNGTGIPEALKNKIFQPFFTTKPTGEGTGLGLSLSYEIITKGHGGSLSIESTEGMGTTFIIELPFEPKT